MPSFPNTPPSWRALNSRSEGLRQQFLQLIKSHSRVVASSRLHQVTTDPADNIFVECADAARADYPVTWNERHFPKFGKSTKIINAREFSTLP